MQYAMWVLVMLILTVCVSEAEEPQISLLTTQAVTTFAAQTDRLAIAGDAEAYSKLLAEDCILTYAVSSGPDELPKEYNRDAYIAMIGESFRTLIARKCTTTIGTIEISPDGQRAIVTDTVFQECVSRTDGSIIRMKVSEKATLEIREGKIMIVKLAATIVNTTVEHPAENDSSKAAAGPNEVSKP